MRSKELWLSRKITPLSNKSVAPRGMKTYSESRIKLRNLQILREMLEKSSQFLSSEQPCEAKSLDVALKKKQELKKYPQKTCGCGQPRSHLIRILNERCVNDGGVFCLLWLVILKSVWYSVETHFSCDTVGCELWLADWDCSVLENFFWIIFQKKRLYLSFSGFSNLFNASVGLFCTLSFA